jgi:hypothetical protein
MLGRMPKVEIVPFDDSLTFRVKANDATRIASDGDLEVHTTSELDACAHVYIMLAFAYEVKLFTFGACGDGAKMWH